VRVAAEDEVVMREVFVTFVQTEVEHDAGACGLVSAPPLEGLADGVADELAMHAHGVAVRHDGAQWDLLAGVGEHASDFATARQDFLDLRARAELDAELGCGFHGAGRLRAILDAAISARGGKSRAGIRG